MDEQNQLNANRQLVNQDLSLRALAFELKNPLINIARQAELDNAISAETIQHQAEQALMLIDGYLLNAQTEYGQTMLDLSPASIGSVLYDAAASMRAAAALQDVSLVLDDRTNELVMTNRTALTTVLSSFGSTILGISQETPANEIVLRGYKSREGRLGIGIFSTAKLSVADLRQAMNLQGRAHMPLSRFSSNSHVSLSIADGLCKAIGGAMTIKQMGRLSGLATELPRSEQLSFV